MWVGVTRGLAGMKFSGSIEINGLIEIVIKINISAIIIVIISLDVKNGWKLILSFLI